MVWLKAVAGSFATELAGNRIARRADNQVAANEAQGPLSEMARSNGNLKTRNDLNNTATTHVSFRHNRLRCTWLLFMTATRAEIYDRSDNRRGACSIDHGIGPRRSRDDFCRIASVFRRYLLPRIDTRVRECIQPEGLLQNIPRREYLLCGIIGERKSFSQSSVRQPRTPNDKRCLCAGAVIRGTKVSGVAARQVLPDEMTKAHEHCIACACDKIAEIAQRHRVCLAASC